MNRREVETLGEPDLQIAGLRLWIHGRQFPDATDYWDGNWLRVTAYCTYSESTVRVHGPIIHLREVVGFLRGCQRLYETLAGRAELDCIEPNLRISLVAETGGHIRVELSITPDHMTESHRFTDAFDQTYLPPVIAACERILQQYPVREADRLPG
jgi:hypothetical protein